MLTKFFAPFLKDVSSQVLDLLFPIYCFSCGAESLPEEPDFRRFLCAECRLKPALATGQVCIICNRPSLAGLTHPKCRTPLSADTLYCAFDYKNPAISKLIIDGKYFFIPKTFELLAELSAPLFFSTFEELIRQKETLISSIPLHWSRKRWRGFNQSEITAKSLSKALRLPHDELLKRTRSTKTQKDLQKSQRSDNIRNAFSLLSGKDIKNKKIILIDDVATSGSTMNEAAMVLKRNGAAAVYCLALARD